MSGRGRLFHEVPTLHNLTGPQGIEIYEDLPVLEMHSNSANKVPAFKGGKVNKEASKVGRPRTHSVSVKNNEKYRQGWVSTVDDMENELVRAVESVTVSDGRGSLLTAGDVEQNPGPNSNNRNVNITAKKVNVSGPRKSGGRARRRRRQRRTNGAQAAVMGPATIDSQVFTNSRGPPGVPGGGRITDDTPATEVCGEYVDPSEGALGWFFKYIDPAGAVETGKALGEFTKVPDALLRYSVDAEQRPIVTITCPRQPESEIALDGNLWRVSFFSFPCFRLNFVAMASTTNADITEDVRNTFISSLNNLVNWRDLVDGQWFEFTPGWYFSIHTLPNTTAMTEAGDRTDSVTQFRKTVKGITFEFNAPTLLDQGWWVGGHIPVKPQSETIPATERLTPGSWTVVNRGSGNDGTALLAISIVPMPAVEVTVTGGATVQTSIGDYLSVLMTIPATPCAISFVSPVTMRIDGAVWANQGDTVAILVTSVTQNQVIFTFTSTLAGSTDIIGQVGQNFPSNTSITEVTLDVDQAASNKLSIEMPAMTSEELTTNNPKIAQYLCKESGGAYIVHYKMNNPVFEMTGEENFGCFQFHYPGYPATATALGRRGIIDTFENNFSSCVVHFWGISQSASIVAKTYDGWEGTSNAGSTIGQFAHTGADEECELLELAAHIQQKCTGVYEADSNFAAAMAKLGAKGLSMLLKSDATPATIKGIGNKLLGMYAADPEGTVDKAVQAGKGVMGIGSRIVGAIKRRRAARKARRRS